MKSIVAFLNVCKQINTLHQLNANSTLLGGKKETIKILPGAGSGYTAM